MKHLILTIIFFFAVFAAFAQHRVTLRTGETYTGKILLRNTEVVVLQVDGGQRYQFSAANVLKVEEIAEKTEKSVESTANNEITEQRESNVFCLLEVSGGGAAANRKFTLSPSGAVSLAFGTRRIADKPLFAGIGASFMPVVAGKENFLFMPVLSALKPTRNTAALHLLLCSMPVTPLHFQKITGADFLPKLQWEYSFRLLSTIYFILV